MTASRTFAGQSRDFKSNAITQFFLRNRGRCMEGWSTDKIWKYVLFHLAAGTIFYAFNEDREVGMAAIAWPQDAECIIALDHWKMPLFVWQGLPDRGDSILIADVAGDRGLMPEILKQVMAHWPDSPGKRLFTYRRGKLHELTWKTVERFASGVFTENS